MTDTPTESRRGTLLSIRDKFLLTTGVAVTTVVAVAVLLDRGSERAYRFGAEVKSANDYLSAVHAIPTAVETQLRQGATLVLLGEIVGYEDIEAAKAGVDHAVGDAEALVTEAPFLDGTRRAPHRQRLRDIRALHDRMSAAFHDRVIPLVKRHDDDQAKLEHAALDLEYRDELSQLTRAVVTDAQVEVDRLERQARAVVDRVQLQNRLISAAGVALVCILLISVSLGLWRSFRAITAATESIARDDLDADVPVEGELELQLIARSFNRMTNNLRRARSELQDAIAELARSNAELEQFAYVASHDLQEPLRMVASFTQLLAEDYGGQLDDTADEYIQYAVDGARRMQRLIDDLLTYSRVGRKRGTETLLDCNALVEGVVDVMATSIERCEATVTRGQLPTILGRKSEIERLFQNLVGNAIKFHRDGVAPKVQISATRRDRDWIFAVADNGLGIDEQYRDQIFGVFRRLHERDRYEGSGIGLSICKKIVEQHGGAIWLASTPGVGTTFSFSIPVMDDAPARASVTDPDDIDQPGGHHGPARRDTLGGR